MSGHKICFMEKIMDCIPKLSLLPFLSGALDQYEDTMIQITRWMNGWMDGWMDEL